jgi:hypothetical protein
MQASPSARDNERERTQPSKKNLTEEVQREVAKEIGMLLARLTRQGSSIDLEASEAAIRTAVHETGATILEKLLNSGEESLSKGRVDCGSGHNGCRLVGHRSKDVMTVVGPIKIRRAYYHCGECGCGVTPYDTQLDIVGTKFSPGVRRLMGLVGGKESFDEGRRDLEELAGIKVQTKAVERVAEAIGEQIEAAGKRERDTAVGSNVTPIKSIPKLYISFDGTGVPVIKREAQGRPGKGENGEAGTREVKLGCVFTQTGLDEKGRPQRDEASTTYVGAIETAEAFGWRIHGEAERRGLRQAEQVTVLADGARWIWNLADEHFPRSIQIVDLYHAREHLSDLSQIVYGIGSEKARQWNTDRKAELDKGDVEAVLRSMRRLRPQCDQVKAEVRKTANYFDNNKERMRYGKFREMGLFVGSGVIEAGCKTIAGQRLKRSGMQWSLRGANAIIALRCAQLGGTWDEYWDARAVA